MINFGIAATTAAVWSLTADDMVEDDLLNEDDLLDEDDLKKPDPASLKGEDQILSTLIENYPKLLGSQSQCSLQ